VSTTYDIIGRNYAELLLTLDAYDAGYRLVVAD
jgi:hypothetical protein